MTPAPAASFVKSPVQYSSRPLHIGIVANEPSGDQLGAAFMQSLLQFAPTASFIGVGGPRMLAAGCHSLFALEQLSIMGLVEVLRHLPALLRIRQQLARHFLSNPPDVFIGIDAPDFNLGLECRLHRVGIPTVHYVSPTVWAWRRGRVHRLRQCTDQVLTLFPFESAFLHHHGVAAYCVGHPLAHQIPLIVEQTAARIQLGLPSAGHVIALLPGSRLSEIQRLGSMFLQAAHWCWQQRPALRFITPLVNAEGRAVFATQLTAIAPALPLTLVDGNSHTVLAAADCVLTASGTATLEALLHQRPMVVAYRLHPLTYYLVRGFNLIKVPHIALSNLLAEERLAPEWIQNACHPETLGRAVLNLLDDPARVQYIKTRYRAIHAQLRDTTPDAAALAVLELIQARRLRHLAVDI